MDQIESMARLIQEMVGRGECGKAAKHLSEMTFQIGSENLREEAMHIWRQASNDIGHCFRMADRSTRSALDW